MTCRQLQLLPLVATLLVSLSACVTAKRIAAPAKPDFSFREGGVPGTQVDFLAKDSLLYLTQGAQARAYPIPRDGKVATLLQLQKTNKSLSLEDVLLVQASLGPWEAAKAMLGYTLLPSGLAYKITQEGTGKLPEKGKKVAVHYKGYLEDGKEFDNSFTRGEPIEIVLGTRQVIEGWDEGIGYFKVGSKGTLRIPANLGYGARGAGAVIPPNSLLFFDIEVVRAD
jgi:FKBP-type peptidyl-prolyl cis-trans isomerase